MKNLLELFSKAYYDGEPLITNEQYDTLERMYGQTISGNGETPHAFRMYSLPKCYDPTDTPLEIRNCVETPKLDGAAISVLYVRGKYTLALTRGDGIKGRDVTEKVRYLVPDTIQLHEDLVQVTGEAVCRHDVPNPRNYVSGAFNKKDIEEFTQRKTDGDITFIAYSVQASSERVGLSLSYSDDLKYLKEGLGFETVQQVSWDGEGLVSFKDDIKFLTDGTVYRLDSNKEFNDMGFTDKNPRGAFALKENAEEIPTTLLDVVWQTGKSGKVTPVAILEPIKIGDATISKATLNNIDFIKALGLTIGCTVGVIRSGEIIPCVISRID